MVTNQPLDWSLVERLCRQCYRQGYQPTQDEQKLLYRALRADPERYAGIRKELQEAYRLEVGGR